MSERPLSTGRLNAAQERRARFFLGRAHQVEERIADSNAHFARILPPWVRVLYPLVRERIRAYP